MQDILEPIRLLSIADADYRHFLSSPNELPKIDAWNKFLSSYNRCWSSISGMAPKNSDLGNIVNKRKTDELLKYLQHSRNQLEHSPHLSTASIRLVIDKIMNSKNELCFSITLRGEDEFGDKIEVSPEPSGGFSAEAHHEFCLNSVSNEGLTYDRPKIHNGTDISLIKDDELGGLAIDFLRSRLLSARKSEINRKRRSVGKAAL
jgi:hypothetical protein